LFCHRKNVVLLPVLIENLYRHQSADCREGRVQKNDELGLAESGGLLQICSLWKMI